MSSSFHKLFPRHISRVRAAIGEENFVLYNQAVQKIVPKILWLVFASLIVIVFFFLDYVDNSERLSNIVVISAYLVWISISILVDLKALREYLKDCPEDFAGWRRVIIILYVLAFTGAALSATTLFTKVDFSSRNRDRVEQTEQTEEKKDINEIQDVVIRKIGLTVNIPAGWTEPEWEPSNNVGYNQPNYRFWCDKGERRLWMYIYGLRVTPETTAVDELETFEKSAKEYINGKVFEESGLTEINSVPVLRYVGTKVNSPKYIYALYISCIKGSHIYFTYSFPKTMDYETELKAADEIFAMIEPSVPRDTRPKDYETADDRINFKSAGISLKLPSKGSEIHWVKDTRSNYVFGMDLGGYRAVCDLLVVWTSENAKVDEYYDTFIYSARSLMDEQYEMSSYIMWLGGTPVLRMAGSSKDQPESTTLYYYIVHKGARLTITTKFPSGKDWEEVMEKMDDLLSKSDFY